MKNSPSPSKLIWFPRILAILFLLFLMIFSFDVFEIPGTPLEKMAGFLIHNLPSIIMAAILAVFWRNPLLSGVAFLIYAIIFTLFFRIILQGWDIFVYLTLPILLIAALFLVVHRRQSRPPQPE